MHIALVSPEFPPSTNWGGIATFNYNLVNIIRDLGYTVTIFSLSDNNFHLEHKNIIFRKIEFKTSNKILNFLYYNLMSLLIRSLLKSIFPETCQIIKWNFFATLEICSYLKQNSSKIDVFYTTDYRSPGLLPRIAFRNTKWIQHIHGPQLLFNRYTRKSLDKKIQRYIELFDFHTFNTNVKRISHSNQIISLMKSIGINLDYIPPILPDYGHDGTENTTNKLKIDANPLDLNKLVYFGRVEHRKGVDILLKAYLKLSKKYPKLELHIIGNDSRDFGPNNNLSLTEHIKPSNKNIFFYPYISHKNSLERLLYSLNGVIVLPSRFEPFGYTIVESMLNNFVVLTTSNQENLISDSKNGFTCASNEIALVTKLKEILSSDASVLTDIMSEARNSLAKKYIKQKALDSYKKLFIN
jgi:glycosyltransferase involved in cell wall biosynthesis